MLPKPITLVSLYAILLYANIIKLTLARAESTSINGTARIINSAHAGDKCD